MKLKRFIGGSLESNGYVLYDTESREALIIDPGYRAETFSDFLKRENLDLKGIFLTHCHYDHTGAAEKLADGDIPIYIHFADVDGLSKSLRKKVTPIEEGFTLKVGGHSLNTIHLPGHTEGGTALADRENKRIFTGDVLFDDDIGRTDLAEGNPFHMARSCFRLDELLDNEWTIYPGHGDMAAMKKVRNINKEFRQALDYYEKIKIKLVALDLDETTIDRMSRISPANETMMKRAMSAGVYVVPATGRSFSSLPENILNLEGLKYVITSNGAEIREVPSGELIYRNTIFPEIIEEVYKILVGNKFLFEIFTEGKAYMSREDYNQVLEGKFTYRAVSYVASTRNPVDNFGDFFLEKKDLIENINIFFDSMEEKHEMRKILEALPKATITSSMRSNLEIGGYNTSKATAVAYLAEQLGISPKEVLACGDSPNDESLLKYAGVGIAMSNGAATVKAAGDLTVDNEKMEGVAKAVGHFIFGEKL